MSRARGTLLKAVSDVVTRAVGVLTFPVLVRYAGADGYGAYGQVSSIAAFLAPFAALGLSGALTRFFSTPAWTTDTRAQFLRILRVTMILSVLAGAAFAAMAPLLNRWFLNWEDGTRLFAWGGLFIVATAAEQVILNFFRARQWLSQFAALEICQVSITLLCTILMLPHGYGIVDLIIVMLSLKLALYAVALLSLWTWNRPGRGGETAPLPLKPMVTFGLASIFAGLGSWVMFLGDRLLIGHFMDAASLGYYAACCSLGFLVMGASSPFLLSLYPRLQVAFAQPEPEAAVNEARFFNRYITIFLIPATLFLIYAAGPALILLGGKGFVVDGFVVSLIVLSIALDQFNGISHYVLYCKDEIKYNRNCWFFAGALNLALNLFLIPAFGLRGAAVATFVSFVFLECLVLARAVRFMPFRDLFRFDVALKALIASVLGVIFLRMLFGHLDATVAELLQAAALFTLVYALGLILMREAGPADFLLVRRAFFGVKSGRP
jgi:O-antigen/teichoic acid export membrane protein